MMMLVIDRFPAIGTIEKYLELPPGTRALYNQYTLYARQQEAKRVPVIQLGGKRK